MKFIDIANVWSSPNRKWGYAMRRKPANQLCIKIIPQLFFNSIGYICIKPIVWLSAFTMVWMQAI